MRFNFLSGPNKQYTRICYLPKIVGRTQWENPILNSSFQSNFERFLGYQIEKLRDWLNTMLLGSFQPSKTFEVSFLSDLLESWSLVSLDKSV